jgi:hypothetical protein
MRRPELRLDDLIAFLTPAEKRDFNRATEELELTVIQVSSGSDLHHRLLTNRHTGTDTVDLFLDKLADHLPH